MKLNTQNLVDLFDNADKARETFKSWRFGQSVFNAGNKLFPEIFDSIRGLQCDPFYNNENVPKMVERLFDDDAVQYYFENIHYGDLKQ